MDNLKNDFYYIQKIQKDLEFIVLHMQNVDIEELKRNEVLMDSMLFRMIQISENAKKLSDGYKAKKSDIPWNALSGLRNRIVHDYGNVDLHVVYETLKNDIPDLLELLAELYASANLKQIITERDQKRHCRRADHAVKNGQHHSLPVSIPDHHGEGSVLAGCACGGDAGGIIQFLCDQRDAEEGKNLPQQIAEKGDAARLCAGQIPDGDAAQAVPAQAGCDRRAFIKRQSGEKAAHDPAGQGAGDDPCRDHEDPDMIFFYFLYDPPVQTDADAHQEHQGIEDQIFM